MQIANDTSHPAAAHRARVAPAPNSMSSGWAPTASARSGTGRSRDARFTGGPPTAGGCLGGSGGVGARERTHRVHRFARLRLTHGPKGRSTAPEPAVAKVSGRSSGRRWWTGASGRRGGRRPTRGRRPGGRPGRARVVRPRRRGARTTRARRRTGSRSLDGSDRHVGAVTVAIGDQQDRPVRPAGQTGEAGGEREVAVRDHDRLDALARPAWRRPLRRRRPARGRVSRSAGRRPTRPTRGRRRRRTPPTPATVPPPRRHGWPSPGRGGPGGPRPAPAPAGPWPRRTPSPGSAPKQPPAKATGAHLDPSHPL